MDDTKKYVTEEEVNKLIELQDRDIVYLSIHGFKSFIGDETIPIIKRMWQEIQDLRSILEKQTY